MYILKNEVLRELYPHCFIKLKPAACTNTPGIKNQGGILFMKEPKKVFNHPDWEIYWPSRVTLVGFLLAWVFVGIIIALAIILARIGA